MPALGLGGEKGRWSTPQPKAAARPAPAAGRGAIRRDSAHGATAKTRKLGSGRPIASSVADRLGSAGAAESARST